METRLLSQLRPRQRPISSQNKATSVKDDCSNLSFIIALFLRRGRGICRLIEARPKALSKAQPNWSIEMANYCKQLKGYSIMDRNKLFVMYQINWLANNKNMK